MPGQGRQMGLFTHALRAALFACVLFGFNPVTGLAAGSPDLSDAAQVAERYGQPFGLAVSAVFEGNLREKWRGVERRLEDERVQLALCDGDHDHCASEPAMQFLAIVDMAKARDGRGRLGEINRAINLAIRPVSDLAQFGRPDVWSSPLVTFYRGAGDCEDYAIAKFVALREAGVPAEDLRIVIMRDTITNDDHAVAAARLDGHWLMLDNRRMAMVEDINVRNYRPLFVIDDSGLKRYVDTSLLASVRDQDAASLIAVRPAIQPGLIGADWRGNF